MLRKIVLAKHMWKRLLGLIVTASLAVRAAAHGLMTVPVTRNLNSGTYCDHCLSAGGVGAVYATGSWPNGKNGACGDPVQGQGAGYHEGGGAFERTVGIRVTYYHAGDTIKVKGKLTANHLGYFQYFLCVLPANVMGGSGERQHLTNNCFKKGGALKVSQNGKWGDRYYVSSLLGEFEHPLKLPDTECARCVLRWYYLTGNSCTPPGTPPNWAASNLVPCGGGGANPEEFWNCADVALLKKGAQLPATSTKKMKGELSSGEAAPVENPEDQTIEDTDTGEIIGESGTNGTSALGSNDIVSFENVMLSVAVGTGAAIPLVVVASPALGITMGLCAFVITLLFFIIKNSSEGYAPHDSKAHVF